jgi:hypothetical protein
MRCSNHKVLGILLCVSLVLVLLASTGCRKASDEAVDTPLRREFVDQSRSLHRELQSLRQAAGQKPSEAFPDVPRDFSPLLADEARTILAALQQEVFLLATQHHRQPPPEWLEPDQISVLSGEEKTFSAPREGRPLALRLTNPSREILPSPELVFSGLPDWSTLENLLAVALADDPQTDREKALALHHFLVDARTHGLPAHPGDELHDPVRWLNSYGYGLCDDAATALVRMARAVGLEARAWDLQGHVVAEVFFDGQWNLLDPDGEVYYARPDGSLAAVDEVTPDLLLAHPSPTQSTEYLRPIYAEPTRFKLLDERRFAIPIPPLERTLRPGESFLLSTQPTGWFFSSSHFAEPPEYGSGLWAFSPVLQENVFSLGAELATGWQASKEEENPGLTAAPGASEATLIYRIVSPYPMLHGTFSVQGELADSARLLLDWKMPDGEWLPASAFEPGTLHTTGEMPGLFRHGHGEPTREILVRLRLTNGGSSKVRQVRWLIGLQVAPRSLPVLTSGQNSVLLRTNPPLHPPAPALLEFFWAPVLP